MRLFAEPRRAPGRVGEVELWVRVEVHVFFSLPQRELEGVLLETEIRGKLALSWEFEEQLERGLLSDAEGEKTESESLPTRWAARQSGAHSDTPISISG